MAIRRGEGGHGNRKPLSRQHFPKPSTNIIKQLQVIELKIWLSKKYVKIAYHSLSGLTKISLHFFWP
jgi:hypothetical protein